MNEIIVIIFVCKKMYTSEYTLGSNHLYAAIAKKTPYIIATIKCTCTYKTETTHSPDLRALSGYISM